MSLSILRRFGMMVGRRPASETASTAARRARITSAAGMALFVAFVVTLNLFIVSAGHWTDWPFQSGYYDTQAEGYRSGHLYLAKPPKPGLLTVKDPYDIKNIRFWSWDYSYYQGHLHLYWGVLPSLLLALAKSLLGIKVVVGDQVLAFVGAVGRGIAGGLLVRALARRLVPAPPRWAVGLAMVVFVTANPGPFLIARGSVYEAALAGGSMFLLFGLTASLNAMFSTRRRAATAWLAAASAALGAAGACRAALLPAVGLILALTFAACWRLDEAPPRDVRRRLGLLPAAGLPFAVLVGTQFVFNHLRFGSWREFGVSYQMGMIFSMGPRYWVPNLWNYLLRPLGLSCAFPFVTAHWHGGNGAPVHTHLPDWLPTPATYFAGEPLIGLLFGTPWVWMSLVLVVVAARRRRLRRAASGAAAAAPETPAGDYARRWRWFWAALTVSTVAATLPVFSLFASSMRYLMDFIFGPLLMGTLGGWTLLRMPRTPAGRAAAAGVFGLFAAATIVVGVSLGFTGYSDQFARHNPQLARRLAQSLQVCGSK